MIIRDEITEAVLERIARRRSKWKTVEDDTMPDPRSLPEVAIVGIFSICGLESRTRWLWSGHCVPTEAGLETPPSVARDYLTVAYGKSPRASHKQIEFIKHSQKPLPQFAAPQIFNAGYYVDISAAFWSIMSIIGWNVDYYPGLWLGRGRAPLDFAWHDGSHPSHKVARNCLVSAGAASSTTFWIPAKGKQAGYFKTQPGGNPLANLQLPRLIGDILNAIAAECVDAGAIYSNTDGFIAPNFETMAKVVRIIADWKLTPTIKASGPGWVRGSGSYGIGTQVHKPNQFDKPLDLISRREYAAWLKFHFVAHANETEEIY